MVPFFFRHTVYSRRHSNSNSSSSISQQQLTNAQCRGPNAPGADCYFNALYSRTEPMSSHTQWTNNRSAEPLVCVLSYAEESFGCINILITAQISRITTSSHYSRPGSGRGVQRCVLSVCRFVTSFPTTSQKSRQLGSPNLERVMTSRHPYMDMIWGQKGRKSRFQGERASGCCLCWSNACRNSVLLYETTAHRFAFFPLFSSYFSDRLSLQPVRF